LKRVLLFFNAENTQHIGYKKKRIEKHSPPEGHYLFRPIGYELNFFTCKFWFVGFFGCYFLFRVSHLRTIFGERGTEKEEESE
jgi:hypothetical protein